MRWRRRSLGGVALPTVFVLALLLTSPIGAQNLLTNSNFADGITGWNLHDLTQVIGFPPSGGVDLATTNPGLGGLSQCVAIPNPAVETIRGGFTVTLPLGNTSGIVLGQLSTYPTVDCSGEAMQTTVYEPKADVSSSPIVTPINIGGLTMPVAQVHSALLRVLGVQPNPPGLFNFHVSDAFLFADDDETPKPDLDLMPSHLSVGPVARLGPDVHLYSVNLANVGQEPTQGPWMVTVNAPPGAKLSCPAGTLECTGVGTNSITITEAEIIAPGEDRLIIVFVDYGSLAPGDYEIDFTASGGGEMNMSNNDFDFPFRIEPPRDSTRVPDEQPQTTTGRGRGPGGKS